MPPFLPRKRLRSSSPEAGPSKPAPKRPSKGKAAASTPRKSTLFDDLDAGAGKKRTVKDQKEILKQFAATDDESSLSSLSEDEFEDIPGAKRQKLDDEESDEEDEDIEFEDVETYALPRTEGPVPSGDLELTLTKDTRISLTNPLGTKKGPSKIERQIRLYTHQMHVQLLMYHNVIRNAWICNKELQEILLGHLTPHAKEKIEKWRRDSHLNSKDDKKPESKTKGKGKGRQKGRNAKAKKDEPRNQRDWGEPAEVLEDEEVNMSRGDPLYILMQSLMHFWKQRFRITAPGLRKLGYMSLQRLDEETKSFERDEHDPERHGELIRDIEDFKKCAADMEGSRDVGAQLFTALLRGIGIESRLVANLQPAGFGWSQFEEASENNPRCLRKAKTPPRVDPMADSDGSSSEQEVQPSTKRKGKQPASSKSKKTHNPALKPARQSRGNKSTPIALSDSENPKSDEESVVDVTPAKSKAKPSLAYDRDLVVPNYWTEILSPITHIYTAVDAIVLPLHATKNEEFAKFLSPPKSDKVRQVTSYIIGHSSDGTAKDVTTRYLKGKMWPGRTKGFRLPPEKVPIHDRNGKVKRYEIHSWFQDLMSLYSRGTKKCPRTEIDEEEEATDLKPAKREKKVVEEGKETLQSYKTSTEFVLERHLKREEAIKPGSKHVKMFTIKGKGDEASTQEKVFRRKDVVNCKSMETWHKEGRAPREGEEPLKRVPYRAATTNRRRELAEAEIATGGKVLQGLFSREQTDWIIPPPIEDGIIPKNSFGNIDLYVESMLPKGAVHIPWRGTVKICKRLGIDYAEAVTGFEFGHRMAVPVIEGVVVAEEHHSSIMAEWEKDEAERNRKEDEKRQKAAINMWRRMLMGLRIIERVREEYGADGGFEVDALNPFNNKNAPRQEDKASEKRQRAMEQQEEDAAGGFFPEGHDEEEAQSGQRSGFFPVAQTENQEPDDGGGGFFPVADPDGDGNDGGFILEDEKPETSKSVAQQAYPTPQSFEFSSKVGTSKMPSEGSDEDLELQDVEPKVQRKGRGRPPGAKNKKINTKPLPAKKETQAKPSSAHRTPRPAAKRKFQVNDTDEEASSLSSPPSDIDDDEEDEEPPKKIAKRAARQTIVPKRKVQIQDTDDEPDFASDMDEDDDQEEEQPLRTPKKAPAKRAQKGRAASASKAAPTKTPRRTSRRSATALRSHYFQHSDEDNDED
ncbi:hypothetical protein HYFRA_00006164 [Hymenoscyphus fraxineus]|uniref:Rad4-domain-containing protein n=1 Tax=Hymenoscyphus fraxineus TaxID=746836 RepID=A0A9N9Q1C2_9HELO|nr:hypothetical protein HYFRA_00006164 [Hymenoscyphus fraxineus]